MALLLNIGCKRKVSQLYTFDFTITGETDQLILIPTGKELYTEIMEQQMIPDQANQVINVELE